MVRLGGFVIHGNAAATLGRCLESLKAVSDVVVAVDSGSTDGSAGIVAAAGVERVLHLWEGYGSARAAAVETLRGRVDSVFFLDSDEWLEADGIKELRSWKSRTPSKAVCSVRRLDWAECEGRRFVYRSQRRARVARLDAASWTRDMVVHEALPPGPREPLDVVVHHRFYDGTALREDKDRRYALLWAVQAAARGRQAKPPTVERWARLFQDLVAKGALWRGGLAGVRVASRVARYHELKHAALARVRRGEFPALVAAYAAGDYRALFAGVEAVLAG